MPAITVGLVTMLLQVQCTMEPSKYLPGLRKHVCLTRKNLSFFYQLRIGFRRIGYYSAALKGTLVRLWSAHPVVLGTERNQGADGQGLPLAAGTPSAVAAWELVMLPASEPEISGESTAPQQLSHSAVGGSERENWGSFFPLHLWKHVAGSLPDASQHSGSESVIQMNQAHPTVTAGAVSTGEEA